MLRITRLSPASVFVCCFLAPGAMADNDIPVLQGSWNWPNQGLSLFDPKGDNQGGAIVWDMLAHNGKLVVVGSFNYAGGIDATNVAAWYGDPNGELGGWSMLGGSAPNGSVYTVTSEISDPNSIIVGGAFLTVGSLSAKSVAKWNGSAWSAFGNGPGAVVYAVLSWDDGTGETVYAGGSFSQRLKKWDGSTWVAVGGGCSQLVSGLAAYDMLDGNGSALYAVGDFASCGGAGGNVAKWDGQLWTSLGSGVTSGASYVTSVVGFDDGSGPAIYIGGSFTQVDFQPIINIARWNGKEWSAVGDPDLLMQQTVQKLTVLDDDGDGPNPPALFAIGGSMLQKWNGQGWIAYPQPGPLLAAEVFPDQDGNPTLHVGGEISFFEGEPPQRLRKNIARWDGPTSFGCKSADFDGDGVIDQADLGILLAAYNCPGPDCKGDADGDGDVDQADLGILLSNFGLKCG